jgi:hypothetical protein
LTTEFHEQTVTKVVNRGQTSLFLLIIPFAIGGRGRRTIPTRRPPPQTATVVAGVCNFGSDCPDRQQHWAPASTRATHISCCTRRFQEFRAGSVFQITICSGRFGEKSGWRFLKIQNDRFALSQ